jgi:hypothetical protein
MKKGAKVLKKTYVKPARREISVNLYKIKAVEFEDIILAVEAT